MTLYKLLVLLSLLLFGFIVSLDAQLNDLNIGLFIGSFIMLVMVNQRNNTKDINNIVIDLDGSVELAADKKYLMSTSSRVCFWGVLLRLQTESSLKDIQLYIFKDSVSTADYSRLCRLVYKNNTRYKIAKN